MEANMAVENTGSRHDASSSRALPRPSRSEVVAPSGDATTPPPFVESWTIGHEWASSVGRSPLKSLVTMSRLAPRLIAEGRTREILANTIRGCSPRKACLQIEVDSPAYVLSTHGLEQRRESRLTLTATKGQVTGWCPAPERKDPVGWNENSLLELCVDDLPEGGLSVRAEELAHFPFRITAAHCLKNGNILVGLFGSVWLVTQEGEPRPVLQLSTPGSYLRPQTIVEDSCGRVIIGEYGNMRDDSGKWVSLAWIYCSDDQGQSWHGSDVLIRSGVNKHVHARTIGPNTGDLLVTSGDNKKWIWSTRIPNNMEKLPESIDSLRPISKGLMTLGGFSAVAVTNSAIYWGTDYWMGTNFIVSAQYDDESSEQRWQLPRELRRNPVSSLASLEGDSSSHVLAVSANQYPGRPGRSALLDLCEDTWSWTSLLETEDLPGSFHLLQ